MPTTWGTPDWEEAEKKIRPRRGVRQVVREAVREVGQAVRPAKREKVRRPTSPPAAFLGQYWVHGYPGEEKERPLPPVQIEPGLFRPGGRTYPTPPLPYAGETARGAIIPSLATTGATLWGKIPFAGPYIQQWMMRQMGEAGIPSVPTSAKLAGYGTMPIELYGFGAGVSRLGKVPAVAKLLAPAAKVTAPVHRAIAGLGPAQRAAARIPLSVAQAAAWQAGLTAPTAITQGPRAWWEEQKAAAPYTAAFGVGLGGFGLGAEALAARRYQQAVQKAAQEAQWWQQLREAWPSAQWADILEGRRGEPAEYAPAPGPAGYGRGAWLTPGEQAYYPEEVQRRLAAERRLRTGQERATVVRGRQQGLALEEARRAQALRGNLPVIRTFQPERPWTGGTIRPEDYTTRPVLPATVPAFPTNLERLRATTGMPPLRGLTGEPPPRVQPPPPPEPLYGPEAIGPGRGMPYQEWWERQLGIQPFYPDLEIKPGVPRPPFVPPPVYPMGPYKPGLGQVPTPQAPPPAEGVPPARPPRPEVLRIGRPTPMQMPRNPNVRVPGRFAIVPLDQLVASHDLNGNPNPVFPQDIQQRIQRGKKFDQYLLAQRVSDDPEARWQPNEVLEPTVYLEHGPPTIGEDLVVDSGNQRVLEMQAVRNQRPDYWAEYQQGLRERIKDYGLTETDLNVGPDPVLVRVHGYEGVTPERIQFAGRANESTAAALTGVERAAGVARRINASMETMARLHIPDNTSLRAAVSLPANEPLIGDWLQTTKNRDLIDNVTGRVNETGYNIVRRALFQAVFPGEDGVRLDQVFNEAMTGSGIRGVQDGLDAALPRLIHLHSRILSGDTDPALNLNDDLVAAIQEMRARRAANAEITAPNRPWTADTWLQQQVLPGEGGMTPVQRTLFAYLEQNSRRPNKIRDFLDRYVEEATKTPSPAQGGLALGEPIQVTKEGIIDAVVRQQQGGVSRGGNLFGEESGGNPPPGEGPGVPPPPPPGAPPGQAGEGEAVGGVEPEPPAPEPKLGGALPAAEKAKNAAAAQWRLLTQGLRTRPNPDAVVDFMGKLSDLGYDTDYLNERLLLLFEGDWSSAKAGDEAALVREIYNTIGNLKMRPPEGPGGAQSYLEMAAQRVAPGEVWMAVPRDYGSLPAHQKELIEIIAGHVKRGETPAEWFPVLANHPTYGDRIFDSGLSIDELQATAEQYLAQPQGGAENVPAPIQEGGPATTQPPAAPGAVPPTGGPGPTGPTDVGIRPGGPGGGVARRLVRNGIEYPPKIVTARESLTNTEDLATHAALVDEDVARSLNDRHQVEGVGQALWSMDAHDSFLLQDGTGVGKSWEEVATGLHYTRRNHPVLIVTPAGVLEGVNWETRTFAGTYARAAAGLGVDIELYNPRYGGTFQPGKMYITTYGMLKVIANMPEFPADTVVIFDEAHNLKNLMPTQEWGKAGQKIVTRAGKVMFASATPFDKGHHIQYLERMGVIPKGEDPDRYLRTLGLRMTNLGVWQVNPNATVHLPDGTILRGSPAVAHNIARRFDELTVEGRVLKRELDMSGVVVHQRSADIGEAGRKEIAAIDYYGSGGGGAKRKTMGWIPTMSRIIQEQFKVPDVARWTADLLKTDPKRQVVIFIENVNPSDAKVNIAGVDVPIAGTVGTPEPLHNALVARGVPSDKILHLHLGEFQANPMTREELMRRFQTGQARVLISSTASGGVGISLDDTIGDSPRTVIFVTPSWSASMNVQAANRVWRKTTMSPVDIFFVDSGEWIDQRNFDVIASKFKTLNAAVKGQVEAVNPEWAEFLTDEEYAEALASGQWPKGRGAPPEVQPSPQPRPPAAPAPPAGPPAAPTPAPVAGPPTAPRPTLAGVEGSEKPVVSAIQDILRQLDETPEMAVPDLVRETAARYPDVIPQVRAEQAREIEELTAPPETVETGAMSIPGTATIAGGMAPVSDYGPAASATQMVRLRDITTKLKGVLDTTIREQASRAGGWGNVLGTYHHPGGAITTRYADDLPVTFHEGFHRLDMSTYKWARDDQAPWANELLALGQPFAAGGKLPDARAIRQEGVSEFGRRWFDDPDHLTLALQAPNMWGEWERVLNESKGLRRIVTEARDMWQTYLRMTTGQRMKMGWEWRSGIRTRRRGEALGEWLHDPLLGVNPAYSEVIDQLHSIAQMQKWALDREGKRPYDVPTRDLPYETLRQADRVAVLGVVESVMGHGMRNIEGDIVAAPLMKVLGPVARLPVTKTGLTGIDRVSNLLEAQRTLELIQRNPQYEGDMRHNRAECQTIINDEALAAGGQQTGPVFDAANHVRKLEDESLELIVPIIGKERAAAYRQYKFFVRYRVAREPAVAQKPVVEGQRIRRRQIATSATTIRRFHPGTKPILNPIQAAIEDVYQRRLLREHYEALEALDALMANQPDADRFWQPVAVPKSAVRVGNKEAIQHLVDQGLDPQAAEDFLATAGDAGFFLFRKKPMGDPTTSTIVHMKDGQLVAHKVHPELFKTLNNLDPQALDVWTKLGQIGAGMLRMGVTADPGFWVRNLTRDMQNWLQITRTRSYSPLLPLEAARGVFDMFGKSEMYSAYRAAGGDIAGVGGVQMDTLLEKMQDAAVGRWTPKTAAKHTLATYGAGVNVFESPARLGEFRMWMHKLAKEHPDWDWRSTTMRAAYEAADLMDWHRIGRGTQRAAKVTAFFNPALQGFDRYARGWAADPMQMFLRGLPITALTVTQYLRNRTDPDYWALNQRQRDIGIQFKVPDTHAFITVPYSWESGAVFGTTALRALMWIERDDPAAFEGYAGALSAAVMTPTLPTALAAPFNIYANVNAVTGTPIVSPKMERLPRYARAYPYTSMAARRVGELTNIAPAQLEYGVRGLTGGLGGGLLNALNYAIPARPGEEKPQRMGVLGFRAGVLRYPQFYGNEFNRFYTLMKDQEEKSYLLSRAVKAGRTDWRERAMRGLQPERLQAMHIAARQIDQLRERYYRSKNDDERAQLRQNALNLARRFIPPTGAVATGRTGP